MGREKGSLLVQKNSWELRRWRCSAAHCVSPSQPTPLNLFKKYSLEFFLQTLSKLFGSPLIATRASSPHSSQQTMSEAHTSNATKRQRSEQR